MRALTLLLFINILLFTSLDAKRINNLTFEEEEFLNQHPQIRVSNEKDWAPYDYSENGEAKGYAIDYMKLIASKLGVEFVFVTDTWSNLVGKIKAKEIDLIHPISYSKKRTEFLTYSDPFISSDMSIVSTDNNKTIRNLDDFRFKKIAVNRGWKVTQYLKENYPEIIFKEYDTSKEKLEAVAYGEAEATLESYMTANYLKQRYLLSNIKIVKRVSINSFQRSYHIASRKDWELMPSIINKALKSITTEEMLMLNKKWINVKSQEIELTKEEELFLHKNSFLRIRASKDYYPFAFSDKNGNSMGYMIDYTNLIAKKLGVDIEYVSNQTWKEAIEDFKAKKLDVLPMMKKTPEREKYAVFSQPILETYIGIATLEEKIKNVNLQNLSKKRVGVLKGYWFIKSLKSHYPYIDLVYYKDNLSALNALKTREIDAVISTEPVLNYLIKENYLFTIKTKPILNNPYLQKTIGHYAIRDDWKLFTRIFNKAIQSITADELRKLRVKWFGLREKTVNPLSLEFENKELDYLRKKEEITMCIDPNWLPYEKFENGKHIGMSQDYFEYFREIIPIPIRTIQTKTWQETLDFAKSRKCDIVSLAVETPKRKVYLDFPATYLKLPLVIATKPDKPFIASINDVMTKRLGVVKGYAYVELLKNKYPDIKLVEVDSMKEGFEDVLSGKLYGFIDSLASIGYAIQNDFLGNLKIAGKIEENLDIGIGVRNDEKALSTIFDKAIKSVDEQKHNEILNKWVAVKYEKEFDYTLLWEILGVITFILGFLIYRQYTLKKQNEILQASNDEFAELINSTIEALYILEDGKCIDVNSVGMELLGFKEKSEVIGLHALDVIHPDYHEIVKHNLQENVTEPYEAQAVKKDGTIVPVLIKGRKFMLRNKEVRVSALIDLTELKHKEFLLSEHTKMVALGEMLSNIAHQWRQPLSVISTVASGARVQKEMGMLQDDQFDEDMEAILINTQYLSKTIDDFRNFILDDKVSIEFDLKTHIEKNVLILSSMLKFNEIEVILDVQKDISLYNLENELSQVMMNIINNAKDAFIEREISPRYIFITTAKEAGKTVILIQDSAGGIPDETLPKIFEPYFTTKHKTQGTGLGLYMSNKIIRESMKGDIQVSNKTFVYEGVSYKGAEFRLTL